jgi:hypothetical protein
MTLDATTQTSAPPVPAASQLSPDFPWPGFAPYLEADRAYFHSRKLETEELLHLVSRDVITLLIGPTGVGKTSLVQAGLVPALLEGDSLPVVVRLDWFSLPPPPKPASDKDEADVAPAPRAENPLTRQLISALESAASGRGVAGPTMRDGESLWEYFHRAGHRWWSNRQRVITPVLIVDRFEEAFTVGRANATAKRHADRFFDELSELASNRPPVRVATHLENGEEAADAFVFDNVPVRVLLVMREEFTARLADLRSTFPSLRRSQFRLAPFTTSQARDAIQRSAAQRNLFADGAVDAVVEFLATEGPGEQTILPAHLSVVCSALSIERAHRGGALITRDFLSVRPGRLMHDFITAAVSDLPPAARALLEEYLTDVRGNSQRMPLADALTRTGLPREALDTLVQRHLVRIDKLSAVPYVSLAHDLLAGVLTITRLERITQAREQSAVLHQAQAQAQIQAQAATVEHKVRQQRTVTWVVGTVAVLMAAAAIATAIVMSRDRGGSLTSAGPTPPLHALPTPAAVPTPTPSTPPGLGTAPHAPPPGKAATTEPAVGPGPTKATPAPVVPEPPVPESKPDKGEPAPSSSQSQESPSPLPHPPPSSQPPLSAIQPPSSSRATSEITPSGLASSPSPDPTTEIDTADQARRRSAPERRRIEDEDRAPRKPTPATRIVPPRVIETRPALPAPTQPKPTPRTSTFNRF